MKKKIVGQDITKASFRQGEFDNTMFVMCDLFNTKPRRGVQDIKNTTFEYCDLSKMNFSGLYLENCQFKNCVGRDISFADAYFTNCHFEFCIFSAADFRDATLCVDSTMSGVYHAAKTQGLMGGDIKKAFIKEKK